MAKLLVCLVLVAIMCTVQASKDTNQTYCVVCNENEDSKCKDPYPSTPLTGHLKACDVTEKYCRKIVQSVNGVESVARQCAREPFKGGQEGCYKTAGKSTQHVCTCTPSQGPNGFCNTGSFMQSSILLVVSTVLFKFLF